MKAVSDKLKQNLNISISIYNLVLLSGNQYIALKEIIFQKTNAYNLVQMFHFITDSGNVFQDGFFPWHAYYNISFKKFQDLNADSIPLTNIGKASISEFYLVSVTR